MKTDFFIIYNNTDEQWATWIAGILESQQYSTIIQAWDFKPGNNFVLEMHNAILNCEKTILLLSKNSLNSSFCKTEWAAAFAKDPTGIGRTLIPVRIDDAKPEGLLAQICYIDLHGCSQEEAKIKLLEGINDSSCGRQTPPFPINKNNSSNTSSGAESFCFQFEIETNNQVTIPIQTKSAVREWLISDQPECFSVKILDKRIDAINGHVEELNQKIHDGQEISDDEEKWYYLYNRAIKKCEYDDDIFEKACVMFFKDKSMHNYLMLKYPADYLSIVKLIIRPDHRNENDKKRNDLNYTKLDFYLSPIPKGIYGSFSVPFKSKDITEIFGGTPLYHGFGDAVDLGHALVKETLIYFYRYLAEEIIAGKEDILIANKKAMSLFNYDIGLH